MKLLFVINCLDLGGAERMLVKLLSTEVFANDQVTVVVLQSRGVLTDELRAAGHEVIHLNLSKTAGGLLRLVRLPVIVRRHRPDVIHSWLYQSDLAAGISAILAGARPVIWSIRQTDISLTHNPALTVICAKLCAWGSRFLPRAIITNAFASRQSHVSFGYDNARIKVIPNGIDLASFSPDRAAGRQIREELGIPPFADAIGLVARFNSQKNHAASFAAARLMAAERPDLHFILCGAGMVANNPDLNAIIDGSFDKSRIHLLGQRRDIASVMNALNLFMLSSTGEGWPNVVGEAMACGVPCVVTDVGDVARIVGEAGFVVPSGTPEALAETALRFLASHEGSRQTMARSAETCGTCF